MNPKIQNLLERKLLLEFGSYYPNQNELILNFEEDFKITVPCFSSEESEEIIESFLQNGRAFVAEVYVSDEERN